MKTVHIGKILRHLMMEKGVSQKEIGDKVSLSSQGVGQVLGKESIQVDLLERFMEALDVNIYMMLADRWSKKYKYDDIEEIDYPNIAEEAAVEYSKPSVPVPTPALTSNNVSLLINVDESKKNDVLKLLLDI